MSNKKIDFKKGVDFLKFINIYLWIMKGGVILKSIVTKKAFDFLQGINLPKDSRLIVTDLDQTIYDTKMEIGKSLNKELLKYLLTKDLNRKDNILRNKIKIFEDDTLNKNINLTIVSPITNKNNNIVGTTILIEYKNYVKENSLEFSNFIANYIEFYYNATDKTNFEKYEKNPIYSLKNNKEVNDIIKDSIDKIYIDNEYKNIENLLYYKLDELNNELDSKKNKDLLKSIIELFEQKKEYWGLFCLAIGVTYNQQVEKTNKKSK